MQRIRARRWSVILPHSAATRNDVVELGQRLSLIESRLTRWKRSSIASREARVVGGSPPLDRNRRERRSLRRKEADDERDARKLPILDRRPRPRGNRAYDSAQHQGLDYLSRAIP